MSGAASSIQVDPALLTKKLTIVAAVAISATALYLLFGGPRKRSSAKNEDVIDCVCYPDSSSCPDFTCAAADEQFQDIITITTDHEGNIVNTEASRCPQSSAESHCDSLHSSCSGEASSAASGRFSSPERACSVGVCTDPVCFRDPSLHGICSSSQTSPMPSYPDESQPGVCNCCGEALQPDCSALVQEAPNARFSEKHKPESRVKERANTPPRSQPYLEMVLGSATNCEGSHYVCWRDVASDCCESNSHSREMCTGPISDSQCQVCMNNNCEKCRLIGCDMCFPNTCASAFCYWTSLPQGSSGIFTSQNQKADLGQRYGTNPSSSPLQQKKKVRWTPNTVEPSCDNQIYRRRQQRYYSSTSYSAAVTPPRWPPVASCAAAAAGEQQPRLQSQAAKNTITDARETVRKNQYNYW